MDLIYCSSLTSTICKQVTPLEFQSMPATLHAGFDMILNPLLHVEFIFLGGLFQE